ncbi:hypothetical protein JCM3775_001520 [Rhodotorula graminis]|uniref:DUF2415 domain-containing protein n=1 Tax=Rhodotorula graminis (strain WP1) TaxID=578459 RepID=A0A0P9IVL9_RHOGW|nr:uncharacterized protein RHOBADRAFT_54935 [Rhodotorula graminis WP1]KPV73750.1 hypothetical protein RHOBADRAFT_54935 [Rhodotorula graminis WP1]
MMQPTDHLLRPHPWSVRATTTASHPQLRDLLAYTPEAGNAVSLVCYDSICSVSLYAERPPEYTPLKFSPSTISTGCGLVCVGGQSSELALKSATPGSDWCHQYLPATSHASSTGVRTLHSGSINNSISIAPSPHSPSTPRVLVSSNDEAIRVFEVAGHPPDFRAAKRRRERERRTRGSVVDLSWAAAAGAGAGASSASRSGRTGGGDNESDDDDRNSDDEGDERRSSPVEEHPSFDAGGECFLAPIPSADIRLRTAVNHCSVSPDGKWLVAVGDTNEVFLYDTRAAGYELAHTFTASDDASFSTDWSEDNVTFAVASQDGFVHVYDLRALPSSSRPASPTLRGANSSPRKVAELRTTQPGPAGAARKVRFSPGGRRIDAGLMAFTEHRNRVHVVDARTFETFQILDVPSASSSSSTSSSPPPLRPRPQPPAPPPAPHRPTTRTRPPAPQRHRSGTHTPRDERERDVFEREMRERSERRLAEEEARVRRFREELAGREGEEEEQDEEEDEEEVDEEEGGEEEDEESSDEHAEGSEDDESAGSSVNTTRARRFDGGEPAARIPIIDLSTPSRASPAPPDTDSLIHRNYLAGYAPLALAPPPAASSSASYTPFERTSFLSRIPTYASPPHLSSNVASATGRTPASFYYATYLPGSSGSTATAPPSPPLAPATAMSYYPLPHLPGGFSSSVLGGFGAAAGAAGAAGGGGGAYYPASAYFPLDSAPGDLLGLDWDEHGERLFVATAARVWEWEVDREARRGSAAWGVR